MPETPCERLDRLRAAREELILGKSVSETRYDDEMVRFTQADLVRLEGLIRQAESECARFRGERPKPRRYAMGARFRPY